MFFDIDHDIYMYLVSKERMPFLKTLILALKIFWNLMLFAVIITSPITIVKMISHYLNL